MLCLNLTLTVTNQNRTFGHLIFKKKNKVLKGSFPYKNQPDVPTEWKSFLSLWGHQQLSVLLFKCVSLQQRATRITNIMSYFIYLELFLG